MDSALDDSVETVSFWPDGSVVAVGGYGGLDPLRVSDGVQLAHLQDHRGAIMALTFSPDSTLWATASRNGTLRFYAISP